MATPLAEMGNRESRVEFGGKLQVKLEMRVRHPNGDGKEATGYMDPRFRREVWAFDMNL